MTAAPLDLIAITPFGLEAVVARELQALGYTDQTVSDGRVTFRGDWPAVCRANLWLRSADRVLWKLAEFAADDFDTLFEFATHQPWPEILGRHGAFPVRAKSVRSQLHHTPTVQGMVKKAIAEALQRRFGGTWFDETGPVYSVEVAILKDVVTLTVDTSGAGLHKRGYRKLVGPSPLKETLAAALVQLSFWNAERPLADPFCGTGTIPIEAALIGRNIAPGRLRTFAAESWPQIEPALWADARTEAADSATGQLVHPIVATDISGPVLRLARQHAELAGVGDAIHFQELPFERFSSSRSYGCVITNPPYGERSGSVAEAEAIYRAMPRVFSELPTWSFGVLTSHPSFERLWGRTADRRRKLYNGRIACTYYQYHGPRPPRGRPSPV